MKIKMLITLAFRYMKYRKLATLLSIFAIGLSLLFLIFVGTIGFSMANSAVTSSIKYPLIIGPEGSSGTQVVMSTIFHIDSPSGLLDFNVLKEIKKEPDVIDAYPIARADNYMSIPIIGTNQDYLDDISKGYVDWIGKKEGKSRPKKILNENNLSNVVLGFNVAEKTGLKIGDTFMGMHGMIGAEGAHKHKELIYRVAAILNKISGPEDYAIYTHYEAVWLIHNRHLANHLQEHFLADKMGTEEHNHNKEVEPENFKFKYKKINNLQGLENAKENLQKVREFFKGDKKAQKFLADKDRFMLTSGKLSAIIVKTNSPVATGRLERKYTLKHGTTAINTGKTIKRMIKYLNKAGKLAGLFNYMVLAIVIVMIFVIITMVLDERKKEMALMRSLGIGKFSISAIVMFEVLAMTLSGILLGVFLGHFGLWYLKNLIDIQLGVDIEPLLFSSIEINGIIITFIAGQFLAFVSMFRAYKLDLIEEIAKN